MLASSNSKQREQNEHNWLNYAFIGILAPLVLSFLIPYLRTDNGSIGTGQDVFLLSLFTGVLFFLGLLVYKWIALQSTLISLLTGLFITGAAYLSFLQEGVAAGQMVHGGNGALYSIAFLFYGWFLFYRLIQWFANQKVNTIVIAVVGLLIAMNIVLGRIGITTPVVRITFAFLPTALIGMLFGPWLGSVAAGFSDILSFIIGGGVGGFFPGFTLSALLTGFLYGIFLHKRTVTLKRVVLAEVVIALFIHLGLNTLWIYVLTQNPLAVILPPRLVQNAVMIVIRVATVWFIARNKQLRRLFMKYSTAKN